MAELSIRSSYVLKAQPPPIRWGRIFLTVLLLLVGAGATYYGWGGYQLWQVHKEVAAIRAMGEPIWPEDFDAQRRGQAAVLDEENAALWLRWAAESADDWREVSLRIFWFYQQLPLSDEQINVCLEAVAAGREPLERLREVRDKTKVSWQGKVDGPMSRTFRREISLIEDLAVLARADLLVKHQIGRDGEAVERARDLMMMARVMEQMGTSEGHRAATGLAWAAADKIQQMSIDLQIGQSGADTNVEDVRKLIDDLLDVQATIDAAKKAYRWDRAEQVERVRSSFSSESLLLDWSTKPMNIADERLMLRNFRELIKHFDEGGDWPSFGMALRDGTNAQQEYRQHLDLHMWVDTLNWDWRDMARYGWSVVAERRMAAVALAIRMYEVEHGKIPARLEELVPKYLRELPSDPFSAQRRAIGYVADVERPILYSVGLDGTDEGGSEEQMRTTFIESVWTREDAVVHLERRPPMWWPVREPDNLGRSGGSYLVEHE